MQRARRLLTLILVVFVIGGMFGIITIASAATDTCECYCAVQGDGATRYPKEDSRVSFDDCQSICREKGYSVAACASTPDQKPQYNVLCFTPEQCATQGGIPTASGATQEQPGECPAGMYYCYPDPSGQAKVPLQVSIGGLKLTGDLGEYISAVYTWMLGAGTTIAIVFLMVAGLRWSLGGLSSEQIAKAKHTIQNAVVGLVLLLFTYFLLFTVNPYLLRLQVPAFPMIRTVGLVGEGSCGYLSGVWGTQPYLIKNGAPYDSPYAQGGDPGKPYTLANPTDETNCGSVADVEKDWEGQDVADQTCTFDYCPNSGEKCFTSVAGGECIECEKVVSGNQYVTPSTSVCSQLSARTTFVGEFKQIHECFWTANPFLNAADVTAAYSTWDDGACAILQIDCSGITSCESYDMKATVYNNDAFLLLEEVTIAGEYNGVQLGDKSLKTVCEDDPCGIGARTNTKCVSNWEVGTGISLESLLQIVSGNDCDSVSL